MAASRLVQSHQNVVEAIAEHLPHIKPRVLVPITDGSEELETLMLADVLTRGGMHVELANVGLQKDNVVQGMHGLRIRAAQSIEDCIYDTYDLIALPGGVGADGLAECDVLVKMLKIQMAEKRWVAAIGSSPVAVLHAHGILDGPATCHPAMATHIPDQYVNQAVVANDHCVTSKGPGTAIQLGLKLVQLLCGQEEANKVAKQLLSPLAL
ncbi:TPA: hypothetical protein N0F65_011077 [Lagenidium giganteum]|uniref:DJ-1/PfpI domain-containing protein n=1 Tax=Lagenidium giganteum TaxID=4803 RepID=A0AAV2ZIA0_9STRA|nr:TPA: hypothetical protein N0F65_011077 [Lagenidium giganteum]